MQATYWRDTIEDGDRKRRRQAEFLVYQHLPWTQIHQIGVIDQQRFAHVTALLHGVAHRPEIIIQRHWYYD